MKITPELILETEMILMRPAQETDFDALFSLSQEEDMWRYFKLNLSRREDMAQWLQGAFRDRNNGISFPYTIIVKDTGQVAGSMSFLNIVYPDLRLEIGASWLGKEFRSTDINLNAKYCMLRFAFDQLGFERVEFKTDVLNERAKNGLKKIGGKEEGVFRSHMAMWNNRRRDSIYFSILKNEWLALQSTVFRNIQGYVFH